MKHAKPDRVPDLPATLAALVDDAAKRLKSKTWHERRLLLMTLLPEWIKAQDRFTSSSADAEQGLVRQVLTGFMVRDLLAKLDGTVFPETADHAFMLGLSFDMDAQKAAHAFFADHPDAFSVLANEHKPKGELN